MDSWVRMLLFISCILPALVECRVRHYKFHVVTKNITRLCSSKTVVTINGKFPGPTLYAREDDTVLVRVHNQVNHNVTIHWHGVRQLRTGWADGPAYITQCPIQPGHTYVYNFTLTGQRGTLLWHAHVNWLRSTVHGALVILPKKKVPYPFPKPDDELVLVLGEWWKSDTEAVINEALKSGMAPNVSDAHTINGLPGTVTNCSTQDVYKLPVESGKTYLLRIINAALNEELFFKIAGHKLTVVEVDATYIKPFKIETIVIAPGQTTNVLLTANKKSGKYLVTASPFMDAPGVGVAAINNVTFIMPNTALLQAHYFNIKGVFTTDFPANPPHVFNYTGGGPRNLNTTSGTKLYRLSFNDTVEVVLQDTGIIAPENHPVHLHGFNFFAVGRGLGNYNSTIDSKKFNLVDPVERNTIGVPAGGWVAIRFRADNPGVWFMHCHLEVHTTWGLKMAFLVDNGKGAKQSVIPPPKDLPKC